MTLEAQESPTEDQRRARYDHHAAEHGCWKVVVLAPKECGGAGGASEPEERVNKETDVEVEPATELRFLKRHILESS
jgi:hypothetical protein